LADLVKVMPDLADRTGRKVKDFGTEGRFAGKVVTLKGAERIARFAVELARKRKAQGKPGKITCVTKSNVMPRTDGLFQKTAERIVREAAGSSSSTSTWTTPRGVSCASPRPWTSSYA